MSLGIIVRHGFRMESRIAFSSNRDGHDNVYSVPVGGGEPTRHTWYGAGDIVEDVAPDGEHILFQKRAGASPAGTFTKSILTGGWSMRSRTTRAGISRREFA